MVACTNNNSDVLVERQVAVSGYAEHTLLRDVWYRHSEHQDAAGLVEFGDLLAYARDDSFRLTGIQKQIVPNVLPGYRVIT